MKKSKVIIPAMALLLFSTAASITGTVAWFSSTRVYSMTAGDFSVAEVDGGLLCDLNAGTGTTKDLSGDVPAINVDSDIVLIDASVCHTGTNQGHAFRLSREYANKYDDFGTFDSHVDNDSSKPLKWLYKTGSLRNQKENRDDTVRFFVAVSWSMTFRYNFAAEPGNVGVYLDTKTSTMTEKTAEGKYYKAGTNSKNTKYGFRIGFFGGEQVHNVVWSNNTIDKTSGGDADKWRGTYVQAEQTTTAPSAVSALGEYTQSVQPAENVEGVLGDIMFTNSSEERHDDETTAAQNDYFADRICTIRRADMVDDPETDEVDESGVTVTCVAWFEGTDPNVISGAAMECMTASMHFYARNDAA